MIPQELFVADTISLIFLSAGGVLLLKVLSRFGTEGARKYSVLMCAGLMGYALFHEGAEVLHYLQGVDSGFTETAITAALSLIYAIGAVFVWREQKKIFDFGGKKHGK